MMHNPPNVMVVAATIEDASLAAALSRKSGLPLGNPDCVDWQLLVSGIEVVLKRPDGLSVAIDFISGAGARRATENNLQKQPLARALGIGKIKKSSNRPPQLVDATAGFGTDAWVMASLGAHVTLLERSVVLVAMLEHARQQALQSPITAERATAMQVVHTHAVDYLESLSDKPHCAKPDVVYLDPMYPPARKQALVKKGMQLLHELLGPDTNNEQLLDAALLAARSRVVVKRPAGAPALVNSAATQSQLTNVSSPNTRFDVYHLHSN